MCNLEIIEKPFIKIDPGYNQRLLNSYKQDLWWLILTSCFCIFVIFKNWYVGTPLLVISTFMYFYSRYVEQAIFIRKLFKEGNNIVIEYNSRNTAKQILIACDVIDLHLFVKGKQKENKYIEIYENRKKKLRQFANDVNGYKTLIHIITVIRELQQIDLKYYDRNAIKELDSLINKP